MLPETMNAAVLTAPGRLEVREVPVPAPGKGQVLVKVHLAGVCGSDHSLYRGRLMGKLPVTPGHEAVGSVAAVGTGVASAKVGDRVVLQPFVFCGRCMSCQSGQENMCENRLRLGLDTDGAFAEYVLAPERFVRHLADEMPDERAVFAEPLAVALRGMRTGDPWPGDRIMVLGTGTVGLLLLQLAAAASAEVWACDLSSLRLEAARALGAAVVFQSMDELSGLDDTFDCIFETSGAPEALSHALRLAAPGGRVALLGVPPEPWPISSGMIVRKELRILGSLLYTDEFSEAVKLLMQKRINTRILTTGTVPLQELPRALEEFRHESRIKTLVRPGEAAE
jgi:L-iditol 2-dehydrogenase